MLRFKNWRRVTPRRSSSGGIHTAGGACPAGTTELDGPRCARAVARSTSRPLGRAGGRSTACARSRRTVSRLKVPMATSVSRRRAAPYTRIAASSTNTGTVAKSRFVAAEANPGTTDKPTTDRPRGHGPSPVAQSQNAPTSTPRGRSAEPIARSRPYGPASRCRRPVDRRGPGRARHLR